MSFTTLYQGLKIRAIHKTIYYLSVSVWLWNILHRKISMVTKLKLQNYSVRQINEQILFWHLRAVQYRRKPCPFPTSRWSFGGNVKTGAEWNESEEKSFKTKQFSSLSVEASFKSVDWNQRALATLQTDLVKLKLQL